MAEHQCRTVSINSKSWRTTGTVMFIVLLLTLSTRRHSGGRSVIRSTPGRSIDRSIDRSVLRWAFGRSVDRSGGRTVIQSAVGRSVFRLFCWSVRRLVG